MRNIVNRLIEVGFSKTEAMIYMTLLKLGKANGYKLAKELDLSKSTIYQTLDSMYKVGYILLIPNGSKEYEAKNPELLFEEIEKRFINNSLSLKRDLKKMTNYLKEEYFYKIEGEDSIKATLINVIDSAKKEIYINTDFNLIELRENLKKAIDRGVRVIAFCFNKLDNMGLRMEIYHKSNKVENFKKPSRIMLVVDLNKSFVVTKVGDKTSGIYTDNQVFINIISEHIHSDIYMAKLAKIYEEIFNENIKIDTLHEKRNFIGDGGKDV
ncbi:Sugar-specific transcriptional regulator TrmB [Fusobacterium necrogenes]|uniref:Sugar-specific transcriptional regulator TrmB n=1 Tax=Fusobacterium necrogenes TaxID=858 RepID=A0A377GYT5_9FUSO|nr:TrmB family transcriptional regulator [Fusobacterium necrogenes]STO31701.1 Sugar-specific transcriptional regulator TrmB [Fusobacterium necrogenes]